MCTIPQPRCGDCEQPRAQRPMKACYARIGAAYADNAAESVDCRRLWLRAYPPSVRRHQRIVGDRAVAVAMQAVALEQRRTLARERIDHGVLQARVIRLLVELQHHWNFERAKA